MDAAAKRLTILLLVLLTGCGGDPEPATPLEVVAESSRRWTGVAVAGVALLALILVMRRRGENGSAPKFFRPVLLAAAVLAGVAGHLGGTLRVLFPDTARDHCGETHAEADRDAVKHRDQGFGNADGGDRVGSKTRNERNVHDREDRLHRHLEHHRNREQAQRTVDRTAREIFVVVTQRLRQERPCTPPG